jgi:hypothetical protein
MAIDESLNERIREVLDGHPRITEKKMFGGVVFLCRNNRRRPRPAPLRRVGRWRRGGVAGQGSEEEAGCVDEIETCESTKDSDAMSAACSRPR